MANPFLSDGDRTLFSRFGVSVRYIIGKTERYMRRINYEKGVVVGVYVADAGIIFVRYRLWLRKTNSTKTVGFKIKTCRH